MIPAEDSLGSCRVASELARRRALIAPGGSPERHWPAQTDRLDPPGDTGCVADIAVIADDGFGCRDAVFQRQLPPARPSAERTLTPWSRGQRTGQRTGQRAVSGRS